MQEQNIEIKPFAASIDDLALAFRDPDFSEVQNERTFLVIEREDQDYLIIVSAYNPPEQQELWIYSFQVYSTETDKGLLFATCANTGVITNFDEYNQDCGLPQQVGGRIIGRDEKLSYVINRALSMPRKIHEDIFSVTHNKIVEL